MKSQIKILIVEDELIIAREIKRTIQRLGYETLEPASTAEEALLAIETQKPDLVLMDIHIDGELDGIETANLVRTLHQIPVIFLTAFSDEATIERAKTAEPYGFIVKPFDERDLKTTIEIVLHKHAKDREQDARESKLAQAFSHIEQMVITVKPDFTIELLNKAAAELTQINVQEAHHLNDTVLFYAAPRKRIDWSKKLNMQDELPKEKLLCFFPETGNELQLFVKIHRITLDDEEDTTAGWTFVLSATETTDKPTSITATLNANDEDESTGAKYFFAKKGTKYHKINISDILWVEALENYVIIHTIKDKYTVFSSMKNIEQKLSPDLFLKTHRSYIVNLDKIEGYEEGFVQIGGKPIPVSRSAKDELKQKIHLL